MRFTSAHSRLISLKLVLAAAVAVTCLIGCSSTKITDRHQLVTGKLPRPAHIWIYNFADTAHELPMDFALAGTNTALQLAEAGERSQQIGLIIETNLVAAINGMGLSAVPLEPDVPVAIKDLMIQGYLLSAKHAENSDNADNAEEDSPTRRTRRGGGGNASKLVVAVECYQMTESGMRQLEYSTVNTGGGKGSSGTSDLSGLLGHRNPLGRIFSSVMPSPKEKNDDSQVVKRAETVAKEIASALKQDFQQQDWLK